LFEKLKDYFSVNKAGSPLDSVILMRYGVPENLSIDMDREC